MSIDSFNISAGLFDFLQSDFCISDDNVARKAIRLEIEKAYDTGLEDGRRYPERPPKELKG